MPQLANRRSPAKRQTKPPRRLYEHLWLDTLHEFTMDFPRGPVGTATSTFSAPAATRYNQLYLKYYADEDYRQRWHQDWPNDGIPPHEDPSYDRDSKLPKPP
jgi:hypothetical protein